MVNGGNGRFDFGSIPRPDDKEKIRFDKYPDVGEIVISLLLDKTSEFTRIPSWQPISDKGLKYLYFERYGNSVEYIGTYRSNEQIIGTIGEKEFEEVLGNIPGELRGNETRLVHILSDEYMDAKEDKETRLPNEQYDNRI